MTMLPSPDEILKQINEIIGHLIETGLADREYGAFQRGSAGNMEITFHGADHVSIAMKDRFYAEIYQHMLEAGAYNVKLLDGALMQMMYIFANGNLLRHRLAFFPSPNLEEFQNNPEIYLLDEMYADVVEKNIVSVPIRFDYDASEEVYQEISHPKSHLTLGQYEHCRIPVTAPLTPDRFVEFIVRNFYHVGFTQYANGIPTFTDGFPKSISSVERNVIHIAVPT